jgi:hypothetical protein
MPFFYRPLRNHFNGQVLDTPFTTFGYCYRERIQVYSDCRHGDEPSPGFGVEGRANPLPADSRR